MYFFMVLLLSLFIFYLVIFVVLKKRLVVVLISSLSQYHYIPKYYVFLDRFDFSVSYSFFLLKKTCFQEKTTPHAIRSSSGHDPIIIFDFS